MSEIDSSSAAFFETKYRTDADGDPWKFAVSPYELQRYDAIVNALAGRRYARAFEPGCSVGVLTEKLAGLCDHVSASDFSPTAVTIARNRCGHHPHVSVLCEAFTVNTPWSKFDLIVLCEIGYYFTAAQWAEIVASLTAGMQPGGYLLASHWLGHSHDHVQSGDEVHAMIRSPLLDPQLNERYEAFRLDLWIRR